ncbi:MAG: LPS assembly protein LptD, partial [Alphaproteobacteria bacterium]
MRRRRTPFRLRVLMGAAACALAAGAAHAQADPVVIDADRLVSGPGARIEATGNVQAVSGDETLRAEKVIRSEAGVLDATGHVEAVTQSQNSKGETQSRSLRADHVTLDPNQAVISANGEISIYQPDGSVEFADTLTFTKSMETGVATNFAARLPENGALAAASVIKRDENFSEMNRAIFTACDCQDAEGNDKTPTWAISAEKVVRDKADGSINFRDAWIAFGGHRVIPLPFFSMADPTIERKSGLLAPDFQKTERRGLSYSQPWLWAISPSEELILTPQINTEVNPFLTANWRRRLNSGLFEAEAGYTYERDFNNKGLEFGPNRAKGYIFSDGRFVLSPVWTWGFTAQAARDRRVFDQYSIDYAPADRGLFVPGDRRLISQIYAARSGEDSYISIAAMAFQSLRPLSGPPGAFGLRPLENDDTLPFVGPLVEFRYDPQVSVAGGRFRLIGSGVVLNRDDSPTTPGAPGIDSSRASVEADWRDSYTTTGGMRLEPFLDVRGDYYRTADLSAVDTDGHTNSRSIATAGADLSWPLVRPGESVTTTIEPMIQLAVSKMSQVNPEIPNEDSLAIQFDDTNLFEFNKAPG